MEIADNSEYEERSDSRQDEVMDMEVRNQATGSSVNVTRPESAAMKSDAQVDSISDDDAQDSQAEGRESRART